MWYPLTRTTAPTGEVTAAVTVKDEVANGTANTYTVVADVKPNSFPVDSVKEVIVLCASVPCTRNRRATRTFKTRRKIPFPRRAVDLPKIENFGELAIGVFFFVNLSQNLSGGTRNVLEGRDKINRSGEN